MNAARGEAERVSARLARPRYGTVSSYDPDAYAVKVLVQPEGRETGWLPLTAQVAGDGWGLFAPPLPGAQVRVDFEDGSPEAGIVGASLFSDAERPAVPGVGGCPAGELWLVHKKGARLRFLNDGTVELRGSKAGTQLLMKPDGSVEVTAPALRVGAEGATFLRLLDERFHAWAIQHTHANGPPPNAPPALSASATSALKGA